MKIALGIEYNGEPYYGWQSQQNLLTVQNTLENALSRIANEKINIFCAGRTDKGVHAEGQVIHFETTRERISRAWILGTNTALPPAITVKWAKEVPSDFHARFSALSRRYRYIIYNHLSRPALLSRRVTWQYKKLDIALMQEGASYLIGEHDFSSFRSSHCESHSPMRRVLDVHIAQYDAYIVIEIEANAFLHHMVRNIVGVLMRIGCGLQSSLWVKELLNLKDRTQAAETAPAEGLYLIKVTYPLKFAIPETSNFLKFL